MGVYNNTVSLLDIIREVIMIMTNYVSDELANKVYHLTKALHQAEKIFKSLQQENNILKQTLSQFTVPEKDHMLSLVGDHHE